MTQGNQAYQSSSDEKTKNNLFKAYTLIKDFILLLVIAGLGYGMYTGYELVTKNKEQLLDVSKTVTQLGTGISIDNQRRVKIEKGTQMIMSRNKLLKYEVAMNYAEWFVDEADKYTNVDFVLLIAIASQESGFDYKAKSPMSAVGLMQLMSLTAMDMCEYLHMSYDDSLRYDPKTNIRLGARFVNQLMTRFNDTSIVIASYNGGAGDGERYKAYKAGLVNQDYITKETLEYVPKVLGYKKQYERMM
jgi:hypothetical protein